MTNVPDAKKNVVIEKNKIYLMSCLEGMKHMRANSVDAVVTDPPYFIEALTKDLNGSSIRRASKNGIFFAEWDYFEDVYEYKSFVYKVLKNLKRILKPKAQVYMFFSYHHLDWAITMIKELGFRYYKPLIWYKPDTMGVFPNQYGCNYEVILWFRKEGKTGDVKLNIGNSQRDVFHLNSTNIKYRKEAGFHPTAKPIKIVRQLVKNCTNENDLVLDPFMGSGTTAVACKEINRNFVGFEMDENYHKTCIKRLKQNTLLSLTNRGGVLHDYKTSNNRNIESEGRTNATEGIIRAVTEATSINKGYIESRSEEGKQPNNQDSDRTIQSKDRMISFEQSNKSHLLGEFVEEEEE